MGNSGENEQERNDAMSKEYKAGDRAFTKVGRNLVEVRVKGKAENGWTVVTRSGKTLNVFATSGGSTVDGSYNDLKRAYPQYTWGESRLMN